MNQIIHDLEFELFISDSKIQERVKELGAQITRDFRGKELVLLGILKGSFLFLSDLCRAIDLPLEISFLRISSYHGTQSTGEVKKVAGIQDDLAGKTVIIVEDIVDTGISMDYLLKEIEKYKPAEVRIATFLYKPDAFRFKYALDYVGFEIPNKFVVGYGLDYNDLGRNLPELYQLVNFQSNKIKMRNIVLFGPPGAGKGTQSEKLIKKYGLTHLSTGDLFRKHLGEGTELGKLAQKYMNEGRLVPDEVVIGMVEDKIAATENSHGFIFDGFPRTTTQAEALDKMLESHQMEIAGMIALDVPEEILKERIKLRGKTSGRVDDQDDQKIQTRIKVYLDETLPVASYYEAQGKFTKINGVGEIDEIFDAISEVVDSY
ncbi:MAG: adenylate kinase [Cyclobacteriaceae bacterium]|nr:adenylate kinase [Cyclobacteriaceae bacterium]